MAWVSVSPLRHVAAEDVLVDALGEVVVDGVVVEEEMGASSIDMIRRRREAEK